MFRILLTRVILTVWFLTPMGRGCSSLNRIWNSRKEGVWAIHCWGGAIPAHEMTVRDAYLLVRHYSFNDKYKGE